MQFARFHFYLIKIARETFGNFCKSPATGEAVEQIGQVHFGPKLAGISARHVAIPLALALSRVLGDFGLTEHGGERPLLTNARKDL
jgi:hypothetical protein